MFAITSFFQNLIRGGGGITAGRRLENFQKLISGRDDYSVLESTRLPLPLLFLFDIDECAKSILEGWMRSTA